MSPDVARRIADALQELRKIYPDWRFGQMVANVSIWAKGPNAEAVWDVEDEEFLAALEEHIRNRRVAVAHAP